MTRLALCSVTVSAVSACSRSGIEPEIELARAGEAFVLAPGESVVIAGTGWRVTFVGVPEDGRCPIEWFCIWAGNGVVQLRVAPAAPFSATRLVELNTGLEPRAACVGGRELVLVSLEPPKSETNPTPPDAYRATLRVSSAPCMSASAS